MAVTIAELLPQFDIVMGIIGGTLTGPLIFILPPLFYHRLIRMEKKFDEEHHQEADSNKMMIDNIEEHVESDDTINLQSKNGYGTFAHDPNTSIGGRKYLLCFANHSIICIAVIVFGVFATITSTYFNVMNVASVTDFRSPCIQNISWSLDEL